MPSSASPSLRRPSHPWKGQQRQHGTKHEITVLSVISSSHISCIPTHMQRCLSTCWSRGRQVLRRRVTPHSPHPDSPPHIPHPNSEPFGIIGINPNPYAVRLWSSRPNISLYHRHLGLL